MSQRSRTEAGDVLTELVLRTFRLNGRFLEVAERLARPVGLTAAWWQVLGATLHQPLPVSGIARDMGLARQSVQRIADLLVDRGLASYRPNPAHRRAKLFEPTGQGRAAIAALAAAQHEWANAAAASVDLDALRTTLETVDQLAERLSNPALS
jgi:DNA-binding MarR family transcriptional regulator